MYLWFVKFKDIPQRNYRRYQSDEFWTCAQRCHRVSFIVAEISNALGLYHDGVDFQKNGVGLENADVTISSHIK